MTAVEADRPERMLSPGAESEFGANTPAGTISRAIRQADDTSRPYRGSASAVAVAVRYLELVQEALASFLMRPVRIVRTGTEEAERHGTCSSPEESRIVVATTIQVIDPEEPGYSAGEWVTLDVTVSATLTLGWGLVLCSLVRFRSGRKMDSYAAGNSGRMIVCEIPQAIMEVEDKIWSFLASTSPHARGLWSKAVHEAQQAVDIAQKEDRERVVAARESVRSLLLAQEQEKGGEQE